MFHTHHTENLKCLNIKIMKKQIRQGVFETNSSSIHTITIFNGDGYKENMKRCKSVYFDAGQYGWEEETYSNDAGYLWTGMVTSGRYNEEELVKFELEAAEILAKYGIECEFAPWEVKKDDDYEYTDFKKNSWYDSTPYVDHSFELYDLFDYIFNIDGSIDEEHFLRYLFNSEVKTGNDNCDSGYRLLDEARETTNAYVIIKGN